MTPKEVYIPVPVEENKPIKIGWHFIYSDNFPPIGGTYYSGEGFRSDVTHYLEKKEGYFLTKEELEKVFNAARSIDGVSKDYGYDYTDFNDWINTLK